MKAVAPHSSLAILDGYGVGRRLRRHSLVKDGVEACIVSRLRKSPHHVADQGDCLRIVQRCEDHCLLQILQYRRGDSLMPVQQRPGVHHAVADRVDRRHPRPAHCLFQQRHGVCFLRWALAQLMARGIAKRKPKRRSPHAADFTRE